MRVYIGIRILGFAVLSQDTWSDLVDLADKLEHRVFGELALGELALGDVSGVGLPEHGVAVTGNNTAGLQGGPEVVGDGLVAEVVADGLLHLEQPVKYLLVGETVERTGETVETGGQRQSRGAQSGTDQVSCVSRDVAALVVSVDSQVQAHELDEVRVAGVAKLVGQVPAVVLVLLVCGDLAVLEDIAVDARSNARELSNDIHGILEGVLPVLGLLHALGVRLGERGLALESGDCERELSHWVKIVRAAVNELLDELRHIGAGGPLGREVANLLLTGNLSSQKEPEKTLGKRLLSTRSLRKKLLALRDLQQVRYRLLPPTMLPTVLPRKRMPSSESRTDPSQTRALIPRAPP